jgi:hypothetical protein
MTNSLKRLIAAAERCVAFRGAQCHDDPEVVELRRWHEEYKPDSPKGGMKCRVCGCTEDRACDGGCSWTPSATASAAAKEIDLCSTCACIVDELVQYRERFAATSCAS